MSHAQDKLKNSTRRHRDENAVKKQAKIAKAHGFNIHDKVIKEPHRLAKRHAMDCGNPNCMMCGNPRHLHKHGLTAQENRLFQDMDDVRDKHSNGIKPKEDEE